MLRAVMLAACIVAVAASEWDIVVSNFTVNRLNIRHVCDAEFLFRAEREVAWEGMVQSLSDATCHIIVNQRDGGSFCFDDDRKLTSVESLSDLYRLHIYGAVFQDNFHAPAPEVPVRSAEDDHELVLGFAMIGSIVVCYLRGLFHLMCHAWLKLLPYYRGARDIPINTPAISAAAITIAVGLAVLAFGVVGAHVFEEFVGFACQLIIQPLVDNPVILPGRSCFRN